MSEFMTQNNKIIGYVPGVFDLFHIGHLNILRNAKSMCDHLIVSVTTDELVVLQKNRNPIVPFLERVEILQAISYVDTVVAQDNLDKMNAWQRYKYDVIFVGSDWQGSERWIKIEGDLKPLGVKVIYFPYTKTTSSTKITEILNSFNVSE